MKIATIYQIINIVNNKSYIGSTTNFSRRKKRHLKDLRSGTHHSVTLQRAYSKYKENSFVIIKIETFPYFNKEDILSKEQYYINRNNCEYNICKTAGSQLGLKRDEQFKQKCSERMKGKAAWNKGFKMGQQSEETKSKRAKSNIGRIVSNETRILIKKRLSKPIIQYSSSYALIKEWESAKAAAKELNMSYSRLITYLNGKSNIKTFNNYIWKRKI